jgi:hypothetical protein
MGFSVCGRDCRRVYAWERHEYKAVFPLAEGMRDILHGRGVEEKKTNLSVIDEECILFIPRTGQGEEKKSAFYCKLEIANCKMQIEQAIHSTRYPSFFRLD